MRIQKKIRLFGRTEGVGWSRYDSTGKILDFSRIGDISNDAYVTSIANFNEIQDLPEYLLYDIIGSTSILFN